MHLQRIFPELILYALMKAIDAKINLCVFFLLNKISPQEKVDIGKMNTKRYHGKKEAISAGNVCV